MFDEKEIFKNSRNFFLILVSFSSVFLLLNVFEIKQSFLELGTFLTKPVNSFAISSSDSLKGFFSVFSEVKTLRSDYFELQEKYLDIRSREEMFSLLEQENAVLKEQLGVEGFHGELILAEVLFQDLALRNESLLINKGSNDGVVVGDIVSIGKMYVGMINEVYEFSSRVRLPTSKASSLKVSIVSEASLVGIAVGYSNVLKVENIPIHGNFEVGDVILINDPKVGTHLYLGNVLAIDEEPTATLRSCRVELPVEYADLKYVFVRKGE